MVGLPEGRMLGAWPPRIGTRDAREDGMGDAAEEDSGFRERMRFAGARR